MAGLRLASLGACALGLLGCGSTHTTQRVFDGHVIAGPYVEAEAYAAFAEGMYLEARGDWERAAGAYRRARARDPDSPGIAARLGALACRTSLEAALDELKTSGIARDYAPAWVERARCLLAHHDPTRALEAARRAVMLEPSNPDANLMIPQIYREQGRLELASSWLFAWTLGDPDASAHREAIVEQARLLGDRALARSLSDPRGHSMADAEAANESSPSPMHLARQAIARGEPELAARHAELALNANPGDSDALVLALMAANLQPDEASFARWLAATQVSPRPPDAEAAAWMAELLRTRVSDDAAKRWLEAQRPAPSP